MDKIIFTSDGEAPVEFYIVGQTVIDGSSYLLVTEAEDGDADALILRDDSDAESEEALYSVVDDDDELAACVKAFDNLLDDIDLE